MSEDRRSRSEIDVGAALEAVETAMFEADELLNGVLIWKRMPTDRRIDAFQDAAEILHHNYHAMRFVRRAFERLYKIVPSCWPGSANKSCAIIGCH